MKVLFLLLIHAIESDQDFWRHISQQGVNHFFGFPNNKPNIGLGYLYFCIAAKHGDSEALFFKSWIQLTQISPFFHKFFKSFKKDIDVMEDDLLDDQMIQYFEQNYPGQEKVISFLKDQIRNKSLQFSLNKEQKMLLQKLKMMTKKKKMSKRAERRKQILKNVILDNMNQQHINMSLSNSMNQALSGAYYINFYQENSIDDRNCYAVRSHMLKFIDNHINTQDLRKKYFKNPDISLEDFLLPFQELMIDQIQLFNNKHIRVIENQELTESVFRMRYYGKIGKKQPLKRLVKELLMSKSEEGRILLAHIYTFEEEFQNFKLAYKIAQKYSLERNPKALSLLGYLQYKGFGVEKNERIGILCFKLAADLGDANGQFTYGTLLLKGHSLVDQDFKKGREYLRLAVKENHVYAVYSYMLSLSIGLNYMSLISKLRQINKFNQSLMNENYEQAGLIALLMLSFHNKSSFNNFKILYEKYLNKITVGEVFDQMKKGIQNDQFLQNLSQNLQIPLLKWSDLLKLDGENTFKANQLSNKLFGKKFLQRDMKYFQFIDSVVENVLKQGDQELPGNLLLHKLTQQIRKKVETKQQFDEIIHLYDKTREELLLNADRLLLQKNQSVFLAETHFQIAKFYLENHEFEKNNMEKAIFYIQSSLSYNSPRIIFYTFYYIYVKLQFFFYKKIHKVLENLISWVTMMVFF